MTENHFKQHIDKEFATLEDLDTSLLNKSIFIGKDLVELYKKSFEFANNSSGNNCIIGIEDVNEEQLLQFLSGEKIKYLTVEFYMFIDKIYRSNMYNTFDDLGV
jgi:hypothetical protein